MVTVSPSFLTVISLIYSFILSYLFLPPYISFINSFFFLMFYPFLLYRSFHPFIHLSFSIVPSLLSYIIHHTRLYSVQLPHPSLSFYTLLGKFILSFSFTPSLYRYSVTVSNGSHSLLPYIDIQ